MKKPPINYEALYLTKYKNLPWYYAVITQIFFSLIATAVALYFLIDAYHEEEIRIGIAILLVGNAVAFGIARFVYKLSAICMSQKVVVADALLTLKSNAPQTAATTSASAPALEEELPEL